MSEAIAYAMETSNFDHAFALARANMKDKLPEVHLKYALLLEDEGVCLLDVIFSPFFALGT